MPAMQCATIAFLPWLLAAALPGRADEARAPVDYVNPNIGTIGHLLAATSPDVQLPYGVVRLAPHTTPGIRDKYLADKIYGFPLIESSARGRPYHAFLMVTTGQLDVDSEGNASEFDHDFELVTPYYASILLEDYNIEVQYTVTPHVAYYRMTFPASTTANFLIGMEQDGRVEIGSDNTMRGYERFVGRDQEPVTKYFWAEFSKPLAEFGAWRGATVVAGPTLHAGGKGGIFARRQVAANEAIDVKIGMSFISIDQAHENLQLEAPAWDFAAVRDKARAAWCSVLEKVRLQGGTPDQRTIFYTGLYRLFTGIATNLSEHGRYYSRYDNQVHTTDGSDFYGLHGNWGAYQSLFPLWLLLAPERQNNMLKTYQRMYCQSGWLAADGRWRGMIGRHAAATILDAYMKGFRAFAVETVYEGMKKNALEATMIPWRNGPITELDQVYLAKGFFPALPLGAPEWVPEVDAFERRQAVSVTLEHCYDDWCVAQMAKALGKQDDHEHFMRRARNYTNVYNPQTGFMAPRTADGKWVEPFDPKLSGGLGGRDYFTENNGWTYLWYVPHDVGGLIELMRGRDEFVRRLNTLFVEQYTVPKFQFLGQFPDATGLIGQYAHGNEPSFRIPYLYNYAGAPWRTQRRVRDIMQIWYHNSPLGICGDEDAGELSSWYLFSAMGFYPVCPGSPHYDIGSPLFRHVSIDLGRGRTFVIEAKNVSAKNKYIQSAKLNGVVLPRPWFWHDDLRDGGGLVLEMGPRPNRNWGSLPADAPPSMSRP